ncbi:uncharacterized protein LOC8066397 [Sorghum bicolor]|uniref:Uncharacterized protein n=1 Tax=Sorghum bicolor TaxID=4558 RepID=C5Z2N3_SORBI|nr:uncharacterized protein LOC8066397 [Sorghum bicolor]EER89017.1 hypothetical protein SORBI_3010G279100 [Sorghum bicolor]|eukprot:XP_002437650.1 uncharacterized protein LOC8066397 [Sorghum bicolor]
MAAGSSPSTSSSRSLLATRPLLPLRSTTRTRTRRPPPSTSIPPRLSCLRPPSAYFYSYSSPSASSYNGWADLAAAPDTPFPFPFPLSLPPQPTTHGLLVLLPTVALALALARLPPLPLLAAAFTAGFAARHLSSSAQPESPRRLSALLADLDAQACALRDELLSDARPGLLVQAVDRLRDAVADAARVAAQQGDTVSDALGPLWEVVDYLGAWARHAVRDLSLSSPRKKPAKSNSTSDVQVVANPNNQATAAQQQQEIGNNKPVDSTLQQEPFAFDPSIVDNANGRPLGMLQFDEDDNGSKDAGTRADATATLGVGDARLERLVSKHRHRRDHVQNDGPFQGGSTRFSAESMESSLLERTLEIRDRSYRFKIERHSDSGSKVSETQDRTDDGFVDNAAGLHPLYDDEGASADSDGEEFSRNVKEAAEILRKARESMMAMADEETADALLYKSARLLSTAVALRPTSLVAVGQLGNTYLLHGELKLKISRELRTLLANSGAFLNGRERVSRSRKVDRRILSRESISSALVDVCEECESLLVEAGRSYRMALSIDSGDVKALYNWGLALIFRAQLLADIGPEAAVDADRVYLAAIDKFDAILSRSNTYAPEALYRWGTALQQRSYLRPRNSRDKVRLLEQAKSLFEDVLYVEADNKMVREALSSCISELNYHGRWL